MDIYPDVKSTMTGAQSLSPLIYWHYVTVVLAFMNQPNPSPEDELRYREDALQERELQIRMRELEAEIDPTPVHLTAKHRVSQTLAKIWPPKIPSLVKFALVVVVTIFAIRLAAWLASVIIVLGIAWVVYKLFIESNPD